MQIPAVSVDKPSAQVELFIHECFVNFDASTDSERNVLQANKIV